MAYDEELARRMRLAVPDALAITEKRMMGGVCFFLNGNMIGGADQSKEGERRLMFRVGKANEAAAKLPGGLPMFLGERPMPGFYFVDADQCDDALLGQWLAVALDHAGSFPPK
ncbi:TfoX/Sxy family protein [Sphingobium sp. HBC34]|uniref:TfoX/Sxy family protein n=1 Tax=Sphingobium cyanobacteriorum TaxID=3063954 RepID=A0ABT8ZT76_9SPHN|nr:TfoX/Sxy family protein [Sphingobium sp. HBC34]MDO7837189.1 TfoX/Sxy family protein [Sphingobium sp. HBC34]